MNPIDNSTFVQYSSGRIDSHRFARTPVTLSASSTTSITASELAERLARFTMAFVDGALIDSQIDPEGTTIPDLFADLAVALQAIVAAHEEQK